MEIPLGIAMLVREEQDLNALLPMLVTVLGIVKLVKPEQLSNALLAILVVPLGKVMLVRLDLP
jgi:hypothetical protein